jgi:hypothetical protein
VVVTLRGETFDPNDGEFVLLGFNPWNAEVRADAENPRAWAPGSWSGAEWPGARDVLIELLVRNTDRDPLGSGLGPNRHLPGTTRWLGLQQRLTAAMAPSHTDVPLSWTVGAASYVLYGRPRGVELDAQTAFRGWTLARCTFRCLDPTVYAGGDPTCVALSLPAQAGGLLVPLTTPFVISGSVVAGRATVTNHGTAASGLSAVIDGPVTDPRLTGTPAGGQAATLRYHGALLVGQWLEIDTAAHTVMFNGVASRRSLVSGDWPAVYPGDNELAFDAATPSPNALATLCWRDAWL